MDEQDELEAMTTDTLPMVADQENIKIYLRIRPFLPREDNDGSAGRRPSSVQLAGDGLVSFVSRGVAAETFEYDAVGGPETEQEEVFRAVAQPITENCLQGYNGTIFA